jgi:Protein of unknown function (DUF3592)
VSDGPDGVAGHPLGATLAGVLLFTIGLAIAAGTFENEWQEHQRRRGFIQTEGTVVAQIRQQTSSGTQYAPLVAFITASGERISFTAPEHDTTTYYLGAKVLVIYAPENPAAATVDSKTRYVRVALAAGASLLLVGLGAYVAWYARRWESAHRTPAL